MRCTTLCHCDQTTAHVHNAFWGLADVPDGIPRMPPPPSLYDELQIGVSVHMPRFDLQCSQVQLAGIIDVVHSSATHPQCLVPWFVMPHRSLCCCGGFVFFQLFGVIAPPVPVSVEQRERTSRRKALASQLRVDDAASIRVRCSGYHSNVWHTLTHPSHHCRLKIVCGAKRSTS